MSPIKPYSNAADSLDIDELTIENNVDRVALYGSMQLTKDKTGLAHARALKAVVDAVVAALEAEPDLPDKIPLEPSDRVDNPFQ